MSEIVLVNTRQENFKKGIFTLGNSRKNQPLGLALSAAVLEKEGFKVKIIDANLLRLSHQQVAEKISQEKPKIVIINTASLDRWECPLPTVQEPQELAKTIKKKYSQALIVAIGPHGTATPDWVLEKCPDLDLLVRGEPELTLKELSQEVTQSPSFALKNKKKILGLSFRENKQLIHNPPRPFLNDLDQLPFPAYHLLPMKKYGPLGDHFNGKSFSGQTSPFSLMLTSRGCPGQCIFCFKKMYQDLKTFRGRSPQKVADELELLVKKYGIKAIYFQDLSFCIDQKRALAICQEIIKRKLKLTWGCEARFDSVNLPLLKEMKKAGCSFINFGLESGSEEIIFKSGKNIKMEIVEKAIADCRKADISVGCFKLLGLPGETKESFIATLKFMIRNKITIPYPFPLNLPLPYPGTKLHQMAEKQFKRKINWEETPQFAGRVETDFFNQVSLEEIQRLTYEYKLKQEGKGKNKHYLRLLFLEKAGSLKSLPKKLFSSTSKRSFSKR